MFQLLMVSSLTGILHLLPHENILTIALISIHYLYNIVYDYTFYKGEIGVIYLLVLQFENIYRVVIILWKIGLK